MDNAIGPKIALIVNSSLDSKSYRNLSVEGLCALLPKDRAIEVAVANGQEVRETARRLASSGADRIIAAGGDGTVSAVAGVLAGKDIPLAILPLGTFNHFARDNGIPFDLPSAIKTAIEGKARAVDVGEVNGHVFINSSSVGIYPAAVKRRDDYMERVKVRKWVAMILGFASVFRRFSPFTVQLEADAVKIERTTPFVFVGNNAYSFELLKLLRRFALTGGQLSLYTARWRGRGSILRLAFKAVFGLLRQEKDFEVYAAEKIRLETRRPRVRIAADGEIFHLSTPLQFRIRPGDLKVIVPTNYSDADERR